MEATVATTGSEIGAMETMCPEQAPLSDPQKELATPSEPNQDIDSALKQDIAPELVHSANNVSSDKEMTWESIAAEITEGAHEYEIIPDNTTRENEAAPAEVYDQEPAVSAPQINSADKNKTDTDIEMSEAPTNVITEVKNDTEESPVESTKATIDVNNISNTDLLQESIVTEPASSEDAVKDQTDKAVDEIADESHSAVESEIESSSKQSNEASQSSVEEKTEETTDSEKQPIEDTIEISEIPPGEGSTTSESTSDVPYTVIEADEVETHEIIEEHLAHGSNVVDDEEKTVVIINTDGDSSEVSVKELDEKDDSDKYVEEVFLLETEEDVEDSLEDDPLVTKVVPKPKKPRGRKSITDIPLHVLGRDITKPTEGVSNGGRIMPKPRLGVKVPYRNLTSQIVTKAEIEQEIMVRNKVKQEQTQTTTENLLFARKLTQRLAKKLIPTDKEKTVVEPSSSDSKDGPPKLSPQPEIKNNSDLIAILEGDDDEPERDPRDVEREIALQQLKELPDHPDKDVERQTALKQLNELPVSKNKFFKSRTSQKQDEPGAAVGKIPQRNPIKSDTKQAKEATTSTNKQDKAESSSLGKIHKTPVETSKSDKKQTDHPKKLEKKSQVDVEPSLKAEMVVKTYTRKRRSFEMDPSPPPKKQLVAVVRSDDSSSSNVYVTKSSRVIKRKVIWDPDENPPKSPLKSPKMDNAVKPTTPKAVEKKSEGTVSKPVQPKPVEKKSEASSPKQSKAIEIKADSGEKTFQRKIPLPVKKAIKTPPLKKPKRLTEIDRLLMDEGAVNMLYDVKNNDDSSQDKAKKKNKSVISLDKAHKELMSRTNSIKNDLQQNIKDVQKSLRHKEVGSPSPKKETASPKKDVVPGTVTRKKSKDSTRSSVHSPPASPAYNVAEASRIIRRHSSSSFSSNDEVEEDYDAATERVTRKKSNASSTDSPRKKSKKSSESKAPKESAQKNNNSVNDSNRSISDNDEAFGAYKTLKTTKSDKLVSIELQYNNHSCYLSEALLEELTACLNHLSKDDECQVVSLTSNNGKVFCHGLDYRILIADDDSSRKKKAAEISALLNEFLRCLLHFPKVLIAGIKGDCMGLGVTMLPLFDMVIASDTSTFSTPYAYLGCVPEAGFLLTVPHLSSHGLASELLYTSQVLKADDAFRRGLLTRLCWPEKYEEELKMILTSIASQSRQSLEATKQQLRRGVLEDTEAKLNAGAKVLMEHWCSVECQENFKKCKVESE